MIQTPGQITVVGEVDATASAAVLECARHVLTAPVTVVDLVQVSFFGVAGVRLLYQLGALAECADTIVQVRCSVEVAMTLQLCSMTDMPGVVLEFPAAPADGDEWEKS